MARPGDVNLGSVSIDGNDVSHMVAGMQFEESVFSPLSIGRIVLYQQHAIQQNLTGENAVDAVFSHPDGPLRRYSMALDAVRNQQPTMNQTARMLTLETVSLHAVKSMATAFQGAFTGRPISSVVESVLRDGLGIDVPINVDATKGVLDVVLSEQSPIHLVNRLAQRAVSQTSDTDGFLFFSGIGGSGGEEISFRSIASLLEQETAHVIENLTATEARSSLSDLTWNNVIDYFVPNQMRSMDAVQPFATEVAEYDIASGRYRVNSSRPDQRSFPSGNPGRGRTVAGWQPFAGRSRFRSVVIGDSTRPPTHLAEASAKTRALMSDLQQSFVRFRVPGNSGIRVGQVIDLRLRENTGGRAAPDSRLSGRSLVTGVTSYVGPSTNPLRYVTTVTASNIETTNLRIA